MLYAGILGQLWSKDAAMLREQKTLAAIPIVLGVLSLGVWSGTVPFCITAVELNLTRIR
jgi:hypothetical protein